VLAFKRPNHDLEYPNPEAMRAYESEGALVRLGPGDGRPRPSTKGRGDCRAHLLPAQRSNDATRHHRKVQNPSPTRIWRMMLSGKL
jgi:hypothetical protein